MYSGVSPCQLQMSTKACGLSRGAAEISRIPNSKTTRDGVFTSTAFVLLSPAWFFIIGNKTAPFAIRLFRSIIDLNCYATVILPSDKGGIED